MSDEAGGFCGVIALALTILAVWALVFGVTVGGQHYGVKACNAEQGVVIDGPGS